MARSLENKPNTEAPDTDYPFGRIRDRNGITNGTAVNENCYGDFHQFFAKMFYESGKTYNELPDNDYSGFQYFEAFQTLIQGDWHEVGAVDEPAYQNSYQGGAATVAGENLKFSKSLIKNSITFRGGFSRAIGLSATTVFTLPAGFRPITEKAIPIVCRDSSGTQPALLHIATNGNVQVINGAGDLSTTMGYFCEGITFVIE